MTEMRETITLHPERRIPLMLACVVLITAGCSFANTTNNSNTNNGSCNAAGGNNSVNCSSGAPTTTGAVVDPHGLTQSPGPVGKLVAEEAYTHLGVPVFSDPQGDTIASGPPRIPFGTIVGVQCYAPNESGMGSVNDFYLLESPPQWRGDYAPANTFLNADTAGTLDPKVPKCPGT
jgi:hypothetical protein